VFDLIGNDVITVHRSNSLVELTDRLRTALNLPLEPPNRDKSKQPPGELEKKMYWVVDRSNRVFSEVPALGYYMSSALRFKWFLQRGRDTRVKTSLWAPAQLMPELVLKEVKEVPASAMGGALTQHTAQNPSTQHSAHSTQHTASSTNDTQYTAYCK
jgi:hypothetical protein